jgi:hypothetical protein
MRGVYVSHGDARAQEEDRAAPAGMTYTQTNLELAVAWTASPTASPTTMSPTHVTCRDMYMPEEFSTYPGPGLRGFHFWVPTGFQVITSLGLDPPAAPDVADFIAVVELHCARAAPSCANWTVCACPFPRRV